jgi:uncharacterized paraquat-inducible protein A
MEKKCSNKIETLKAIEFSMKNKQELQKHKICGCYSCTEIYTPQEIIEFVDNDQTALCPKCHIDSVLPDNIGFPITKENLEILRRIYF